MTWGQHVVAEPLHYFSKLQKMCIQYGKSVTPTHERKGLYSTLPNRRWSNKVLGRSDGVREPALISTWSNATPAANLHLSES